MDPINTNVTLPIQAGDVVDGLEKELVHINRVEAIGNRVVIDGYTVESKTHVSRPVSIETLQKLRVVSRSVSGYTYDGDAKKFLLGTEALRIGIAYQYDPLFAVSSSIVDPLPHQLEAVYHFLLPLHRIRFLLGDDTGAGKTIMAGLLLKELMFRGTVERVLIVTPGGLTKQWQEDEMQSKFGLNFELINRERFYSNPSVFHTANLCITSIDFIRQEDVLQALKNERWDMIVVDEAHKLSAYEYGSKTDKGDRYKAVESIADKTEHLLLLTATPHRGRKDTFRFLLQLLDPDLFRKDEHVERYLLPASQQSDVVGARNSFFLRRLKEKMVDWYGMPLFKPRHTKTLAYELSKEELDLYTRVTEYVRAGKKEAKKQKNRNVELALMVMQRRLTSSLRAITKTLENRLRSLGEVYRYVVEHKDEIAAMKKFLAANKAVDETVIDIDDVEDLDDQQRSDFEKRILAKTLSSEPDEIRKEMDKLESLVAYAQTLRGHDESKYTELKNLLDQKDIMRSDEKLVIFTEYTDTMDYLSERLKDAGYITTIIHGGMDVDQRKEAQKEFLNKSQIMIATDAAGEGINLQFCRFLINWDIPWNPNRLEQRMGRIHRYGQKHEVYVYNLVARNTREGSVMEKVLTKLDVMREQLGNDRVYDVISQLFEDIPLSEIIQQALENTTDEEHQRLIDSVDDESFIQRAKELTDTRTEQALATEVRWRQVRDLKEASDERRLQPLYVQRFFTKAYSEMGGKISVDGKNGVYRILSVPDILLQRTTRRVKPVHDKYEQPFVFDKNLMSPMSRKKIPENTRLLGPGHELFDAVLDKTSSEAQEAFAKGATLIDPTRKEPAWLWILKSTVTDGRKEEPKNIADQSVGIVVHDVTTSLTSPALLLDMVPGVAPAEQPQSPMSKNDVMSWAFEAVSDPLLEAARKRRQTECDIRKTYLEGAFQDLIADRTSEIAELEQKEVMGEDTFKEQEDLRLRVKELRERKALRLREVEDMLDLNPTTPEVISAAHVIPLASDEIGEGDDMQMRRDDEVERIAMEVVMKYEIDQGRNPFDVSKDNLGYDVRSIDPRDETRRYVEVKGRAENGGIMLSENEYNRLRQLEDAAWLYVVTYCKTKPELSVVQNPGNKLSCKPSFKDVQYFVPEKDWRGGAKKI